MRKISYLRQLGVEVEVLAMSVNSRETADKLFEHAFKMGPVGGIYNIATVSKNILGFENVWNNSLER